MCMNPKPRLIDPCPMGPIRLTTMLHMRPYASMPQGNPSVTAQHGDSEPSTSATLRKTSLQSVIHPTLVHDHSRVSGNAGDERSTLSAIIPP